MKKSRKEKKKQGKEEKWPITELFTQVPVSFLPGSFLPETPLQSTGEFSPLFCGPLTNPQTYVHSVGRACHLIFPTTAAGRAWPHHGHVTGWETVLGKRILLSSLSSPVSWREIELPSEVWNRYIHLNRGSCHHFETVWPPKDTIYNMNETCPQSDDAIFFFFQQVDQKVCFLNSQSQYLYSCLIELNKTLRFRWQRCLLWCALSWWLPCWVDSWDLDQQDSGSHSAFDPAWSSGPYMSDLVPYMSNLKFTHKGQGFVSREDFQKNLLKAIPKERHCKTFLNLTNSHRIQISS